MKYRFKLTASILIMSIIWITNIYAENKQDSDAPMRESAVKKGNYVLGIGNIADFRIGGGDAHKGELGFSVNPQMFLWGGYYLIEGLCFGGGATFMYQRSETEIYYGNMIYKTKPKIYFFGLGPVLAYYFRVTENIYPFIMGNFIYARGKANIFDTYKPTIEAMSYGGALGIMYVFKNNLGIYLSISHIRDRLKNPEGKQYGYYSNADLGLKVFF